MEQAQEGLSLSGAPLDELTKARLWSNPCWLSFRINYLAFQFNGPVYGAIEQRYDLLRPEFLALYSVGLHEGVAAKTIVTSSGFPKNTISRAIQKLLRRRLVRRAPDSDDRRSFELRLTAAGKRIVDEVTPMMVAREERMLSALDAQERSILSNLMARMVMDSPAWPDDMLEGENS